MISKERQYNIDIFTFCHQAGLELSRKRLLQERKKIDRFAQIFPKSWHIPLIHFEFIPTSKKTADFLFYIEGSSLIEKISIFPNQKAWSQLCSFINKGIEELFFKKIPGIWLEFDCSQNIQWPPNPNLLFRIKNMQNEKRLEVIDKASSFLGKKKLSSENKKVLRSCFKAGFTIDFIGFMLARNHSFVRIGMKAKSSLKTALSILKYLQNADPFYLLVEKFKNFPEGICLSFDLGEKMGERIGLEYKPLGFNRIESGEFWKKFFHFLLEEGWLCQEKKDLFLSWVQEPVIFKESQIYLKDINHVKFVYIPDQPIQMKVYIGILGEDREGV